MRSALAFAVAFGLSVPAIPVFSQRAAAYDVERYYVYCADDRIEVSFWDIEQMMVRRGSDVCQFMSYTSYGSALDFAKKNFGGEGSPCSCRSAPAGTCPIPAPRRIVALPSSMGSATGDPDRTI